MSYIIIHKEKGIFNNIAEVISTGQKFEIFSKDEINKYSIFFAKTFETPLEAVEYINSTFNPTFAFNLEVIEIEGKYPEKINYFQLIKNGMSEHTGYMINSIPMISDQIH